MFLKTHSVCDQLEGEYIFGLDLVSFGLSGFRTSNVVHVLVPECKMVSNIPSRLFWEIHHPQKPHRWGTGLRRPFPGLKCLCGLVSEKSWDLVHNFVFFSQIWFDHEYGVEPT